LRRPGSSPRPFFRKSLLHLLAICLLCAITWIEFGITTHAQSFDHTNPSVDVNCQQLAFSPDGNPFPLCPGPYPGGGNCVWWTWEQWHLLGYNLPLNWGNAADWVVDAERFGLPVGTQPRLASIAVFPVADGVWAFGAAGHVAFVTWVSQDQSTFNVTYQNYGDPTSMFTGTGYNVSYINQPRFQNGQLRFIYFPGTIDASRFTHLPGIDGNAVAQTAQVAQANRQMTSDVASGTAGRVALGLPPGAYDQEFNADFTGTGLTDLLLYNRQQGSLDVLTFSHRFNQPLPHFARSPDLNQPPYFLNAPSRVSLGDALTPANGWGSSLDIVIGDFSGSRHASILLYNRVTGTIQLLGLTPQLTIEQHVVLPGWGPGWEFYVGQFDGAKSDLFMYNRLLVPDPSFLSPTTTPSPSLSPNPTQTPTNTPTQTVTSSPSPSPITTPIPTITPTATASPSPTTTPTLTPSPTTTPTPTITPSPSASPSPTTTPTATPTPTITPGPSPTTTPTLTPSPTTTPTITPSPNPSPTSNLSPSPTTPPSPTAAPTSSPSATQGPVSSHALPATMSDTSDTPQKPGPGDDLSGINIAGLQNLQPPPLPNVLLLSFTSDLHIKQQQAYTLMHDSWEVYIGRFSNAHQDGLFLYDRTAGEARIIDFTSALLVNHYQQLHNLVGNWDIHTGDFSASGRAQVLLYDPGTGDLQFLAFAPDLSPLNLVDNSGLNTGQVLYVGHFGLPALSVMLYDPLAGQSTFIAFDSSLHLVQQITVQSWNQNWQVLIGTFLNRSTCHVAYHCTTLDDVLALNRQTGQIQQYTFTFGNQYRIFDNRLQAFLRYGVATTARLNTIDTSSFNLQSSLDASITTEELY
jgi:cell division septation protein DedD